MKAYQKYGKPQPIPALCAIAMAVLLQACALPQPETGLQDAPAWHSPENAEAWPVDRSVSRVRVLVYRDGPLARFGHNHVIDFDLQGTVYRAADVATSGFELEIPLHSAVIDAVDARDAEGDDFPDTLSEQARHETRSNMLGDELLAADAFPLIRIESIAIVGPAPGIEVKARIQVRDRVFEYSFPATVVIDRDSIRVESTVELTQTGLGLEQYSALGGGLQVADRFTVKLQLLARAP
jgi:hypothetical protein